jgi:glycosyltransferase involved in cell wall biosynthesis
MTQQKNGYQVLIVASHRPDRAPNQRFRFEQYTQYLAQHGVHCTLSYLISENEDRFLYQKRNYFKKFQFLRHATRIRKRDLRSLKDFHLVFVCREALMTGSIFFEKAVKDAGIPMIFDFDDAIWLMNVSRANRYFSFLKNPGKTKDLIALSNMVFAGNQYLADYALQFNSNVRIIPTTINTEEYKPLQVPRSPKVVIGWSGSITTIQHFKYAIPFLEQIRKKFGDAVEFRVIGDGSYTVPELDIQGLPWKKETELNDLCAFDIGIMPLPDDEWAKGKCGLKGLQYMALEIPTIMSPVGVNTEIIDHGKNGYLATTEQEWMECLSRLIEDKELRQSMGKAARQTVIERYSIDSQKEKYLEYFTEAITSHGNHNRSEAHRAHAHS